MPFSSVVAVELRSPWFLILHHPLCLSCCRHSANVTHPIPIPIPSTLAPFSVADLSNHWHSHCVACLRCPRQNMGGRVKNLRRREQPIPCFQGVTIRYAATSPSRRGVGVATIRWCPAASTYREVCMWLDRTTFRCHDHHFVAIGQRVFCSLCRCR